MGEDKGQKEGVESEGAEKDWVDGSPGPLEGEKPLESRAEPIAA